MAIGPGTLVLVVGPSGAGKDTLIGLARAHLDGDPRYVFPRRLVTRTADPALEDHHTHDEAAYADLVAAGRCALHWRAHDLGYALPASVDADIAAGRTVVVNVSRAVVAAAAAKYANLVVAYIDAPRALRAARIGARGREDPASATARAARAVALPDAPHLRILNDGPPETAAAVLLALITGVRAVEHAEPVADAAG